MPLGNTTSAEDRIIRSSGRECDEVVDIVNRLDGELTDALKRIEVLEMEKQNLEKELAEREERLVEFGKFNDKLDEENNELREHIEQMRAAWKRLGQEAPTR